MAQMSLSDLQTQVLDWLPGKSTAAIARAANLALRKLYAYAGPTLRTTLSSTAPYTTGTVAIANGATAVTMATGTWAASTDGQLIQCEGEPTWYGLTRLTANTGTLSSAFAGADLTVGTYTVAYAFYDLPTTLSAVFNIWRDPRTRLTRMNDEEYARWMSSPQSPGMPLQYAVVKGTHASNSAVRIQLVPYPDDVYTFVLAGRTRPTLFANSSPTTEYSGLPEDYDPALLAGTLDYLMDQRDAQARAAWWHGAWKEALSQAQATQNEGFDGQFGEAAQGYGWDLWQGPVT